MMKSSLLAVLVSVGLAMPTLAAAPAGRRTGSATVRGPISSGLTPPAPQARLSPEYSLLGQPRSSIFDENRGVAVTPPPIGGGTIIRPPAPVAPPPPVFRAALIDDAGPMALLEFQDRTGIRNLLVRPGQWVEEIGGRVESVTLNTMRLVREGAGRTIQMDVPVGSNIEGVKVDSLPLATGYVSGDTAPPTSQGPTGPARTRGFGRSGNGFAPAGRPGGTGGPAAAAISPAPAFSAASMATPATPAEIEARMIQRRQSELNGTGTPTLPATMVR